MTNEDSTSKLSINDNEDLEYDPNMIASLYSHLWKEKRFLTVTVTKTKQKIPDGHVHKDKAKIPVSYKEQNIPDGLPLF